MLLTIKLGSTILIMTSKLGITKKEPTKMEKDEVLAKSRKENKNKDIFESEVIKEGTNTGAITAGVLATIFFTVQIFTGGGTNYGLYAVAFSIPAATFVVKAIRLKRRHEYALAAFYVIFVLLLSAAHIYNLVTAVY